jgi:hypothetical protein
MTRCPTLLHRFLDGARRASPVARRILVTVLPLPPRRSERSLQPECVRPCCLRLVSEDLGLRVFFFSRPPVGSLALRPGDSLTIPKMALSIGFKRFVFLPPCDPSYGDALAQANHLRLARGTFRHGVTLRSPLRTTCCVNSQGYASSFFHETRATSHCRGNPD